MCHLITKNKPRLDPADDKNGKSSHSQPSGRTQIKVGVKDAQLP
jgi:hypothetical protein